MDIHRRIRTLGAVARAIGPPALATAFFAWRTRLIEGWGLWYSSAFTLRLQTDAFLLGKLSIQDSPARHGLDWAWNGGWHQVWGMGVPLLRLPFEVMGALVHVPFPDRFVVLLMHFAVGLAVFSWSPFLERQGRADKVRHECFRTAMLVLLLLSPPLQNLCGVAFGIYEEVVAFGILWSILAFSLMIRTLARPSSRSYFVMALLAAFSIQIRPTSFVYCGLAFGALTVFQRGLDWRKRGLGALIVGLGPASVLLFNWLRFGSPFELGHNMNISGLPETLIFTRWGVPFAKESLWRASGDLIGSMFFEKDLQAWLAPTWRVQELYYRNFNAFTPILFLASVVAPFALRRNTLPRERLASLWSLTAFVALFILYVRFSAITSRYISDFLPAVLAALAVAVACIATVRHWLAPVLVLVTATIWALHDPPQQFPHSPPYCVDREWIQVNSARWRVPWPNIPNEYVCGGGPYTDEIAYNTIGWSTKESCAVPIGTYFFFENASCLQLEMEPMDRGQPTTIADIAVRLGRSDWRRVKEEAKSGGQVTQTYCPETPLAKGEGLWRVQLFAIRFIKPDDIGHVFRPNIKLLAIRAVAEGGGR
jgi:hypothetical protein